MSQFISYDTLQPAVDARAATYEAIRDRVLSAIGAWRGMPTYGTSLVSSITGGTIREDAPTLESEIRTQLARDASLYTVDDVFVSSDQSTTTLTVRADDIEFSMAMAI